ncbi:MAG TPA: diphthamide biosynthesis enzyme Dph2 [Candidatus Limnocylindrales bacterium]|nr:diphthamide biosynthesis enzyme Dph2 [Candidatus Limnocylindrales bacterium]
MKGFDFEEERIKQEITKLGAKRVLLQLPEGLKPEGLRLAKIVEKIGALPIISADSCYGACDIAIDEAEDLGADLIVHFGHSRILTHERVPTVYVEARSTVPVENAVEQALPLLSKYVRIGLATSIQHAQALNLGREILVRAGKTVVIGDSGQLSFPGQVSGCNYSNVKSIADEVDAFLFVGGGLFHALGVALSASKPTVIADPYDNRAFSVDDEAQKIIKQRWASIEEARGAKTFGIIIGLKPGQKRVDAALKIKDLAQKQGGAAYLLAAKEITPEELLAFPSIDAYVNTACPRIGLDASGKFSKPVLTINEFMVAIGESSWENVLKKGLFESWN